MILKGENQEIELIVKGYEFPKPKLKDSFWDYNWLMLYCRKTIEGKTVSGRFPCFVTTELKHLQGLLEQFLNSEIEFVEWGGTEPNFQIILHKNRLLEVFFYSETSQERFDEVKVFKKQADDNDIRSLIKFCEDSLNKYPIREVEENKENKIIIYSKKKIFIQLLYAYLREYIERQNREREHIISIIIEGRSSMELIEAELCRENYTLLLDCSDREEIEDLRRLISKKAEYYEDAGEKNIESSGEVSGNKKIDTNENTNSNEKAKNNENVNSNEKAKNNENVNSNEKAKNNESLSSNKKSAHIILLDNMYYKIEEKLYFQEQDNIYFISDLEKLTEVIEEIICAEDNPKKLSDNLTRREKEILILITKGKLNKEIANELNITERTVKNHIANLFRKINVYDRTQAAVYAIKNGIYHLYLEDL